MIYNGRVYIDTTLAKSTLTCGLQSTLRHIYHLNSPEESMVLKAGTVVHECLAHYYCLDAQVRSGRPCPHTNPIHGHWESDATNPHSTSALKLTFTDLYLDWATEHIPSDHRLAFQNVYTILEEWFESAAPHVPWVVQYPEHVEIGFAFPLESTGKYNFYGRLDLLAVHKLDGALYVVDHKSTGRMDQWWGEQWIMDPQVTGYNWGALQHNDNVAGFIVNGIELPKLPSSDRKCKDHGLAYNECGRYHSKRTVVGPIKRSVETIERWRVEMLEAAKRYEFYSLNYGPGVEGGLELTTKSAPMEGPFTGGCKWCDLREWCGSGQNVLMLNALGFEEREWYPWDPREVITTEVAA